MLDYREILLSPISVLNINFLASEILNDSSRFEKVYHLMFDQNKTISWRAAWLCQKISEKQPQWFSNEKFYEITQLSLSTNYSGLLRGCLSILNHLTLPDPIPVELINSCFDWMISPKMPIAVQSLSMKLLYSICQKEPDLKSELQISLENIDFEFYSTGFNSVRKNILKRLNAN